MKSALVVTGCFLSFCVGASAQTAAPPKVPLCTGLSVVTAISQKDGDYESIKTIESVTSQQVRLKYSSERMFKDEFSDEEPKLKQTIVHRTIRTEDLNTSNLYEQQFDEQLPELIPGTTAIGTSTAILNKLKKDGEAEIGIFIAFSAPPSLDPNDMFYLFRNQMLAKIQRVECGWANVALSHRIISTRFCSSRTFA